MTEIVWNNIIKAVIVFAVVAIVLMFIGIIPNPVKDTLSALGIIKEEAKTDIPTSTKYITITSTEPSLLNKGKAIYSYDAEDWTGVKKPAIDSEDTVILEFDKYINKTKGCIEIFESNKAYSTTPSKQAHWTLLTGKRFNESLEIEDKKLTIKGFKKGNLWFNYFYMIKFKDCFRSTNDKPINPDSAIVKFRTN